LIRYPLRKQNYSRS